LDVSHARLDPRDGRTIYAAATGNGFTAVHRSRDRGRTWEMAGRPFEVDQVWHVEPGHSSQPGRVYAGTMPAALYASDDGGDNWRSMPGLGGHASRGEWWEGGSGGINVHRILIDPERPERFYAGISVAGLFRTDDGGATWIPKNEGVFRFTEWGDELQHPDVHRCVHSAVLHPHDSRVIFQQNHVGVYRSDDGGESWHDITTGLPSSFGFAIAVTRQNPPAVFVVPQDADQIRMSGQLTVYRTRDGGSTWTSLATGLPVVEKITLYREAMTADHRDPAGVYFGTSDGTIWGSQDTGDHWNELARDLPPIRSLTWGVAG
jgi:photosystem II stability/assembly factor-like uncharacterized protein